MSVNASPLRLEGLKPLMTSYLSCPAGADITGSQINMEAAYVRKPPPNIVSLGTVGCGRPPLRPGVLLPVNGAGSTIAAVGRRMVFKKFHSLCSAPQLGQYSASTGIFDPHSVQYLILDSMRLGRLLRTITPARTAAMMTATPA